MQFKWDNSENHKWIDRSNQAWFWLYLCNGRLPLVAHMWETVSPSLFSNANYFHFDGLYISCIRRPTWPRQYKRIINTFSLFPVIYLEPNKTSAHTPNGLVDSIWYEIKCSNFQFRMLSIYARFIFLFW